MTEAPFIVDLADAVATVNAVDQVRAWAGDDPLSLVYNAFALQQGPADQPDEAETERAMRVKFIAATQLTALVAPAMRTLWSRVTACRRPGRCAPFARSR